MKRFLFPCLLAVASIGFIACAENVNEPAREEKTTDNGLLSAKDFSNKMKNLEGVQLVDVRTPEEYGNGYITGAVNMNFNADDFSEQAKALNKEKPVMVYCKGGGRSGQATEQLKEMGFKQVYDLDGGIMAWENTGFPLEMESAAITSDKYTSADFKEVINSHKKVVVDFYATWCAPCKRMGPVLEKVESEYVNEVTVVRINADEAKALCKELGLMGVPVLMAYKDGKQVSRADGEQTEEGIRKIFSALK